MTIPDPQSGPRISAGRLPVGLAIGASTGGPKALLSLLPALRLPPGVFGFLVQHIQPHFVHILRRRLMEVAAMPIEQAVHEGRVAPGRLYLAPGGRHLLVERMRTGGYRTRLSEDPPLHGVRPSLDPLFISLAAAFGPRAVGVVLTGMGRDGLDGARAIKVRGGKVLAEAESTCAVYGMPRALAEAGLADRQLPLDQMARAIEEACQEATRLPVVPRAAG
ncbi:MAG TPA: CheB methylesterase domain-containing protein [Candidatus Sulfotelmatobacter sp.]|nr:CheB methylesterase domain-containing protein [Candidatus Sulfotelmatobacter sp.]